MIHRKTNRDTIEDKRESAIYKEIVVDRIYVFGILIWKNTCDYNCEEKQSNEIGFKS